MRTVKIFMILIFTICNATNAICQKGSEIVGKWDGQDYWKNKSELIFSSDGYVTLTINGEKIGGENFIVNGKEASLKYEIDFLKKPFCIDLITYSRNEKTEKARFLGIINFLDQNNAEIILSFDGKRIQNFNEENKENVIVMKRRE